MTSLLPTPDLATTDAATPAAPALQPALQPALRDLTTAYCKGTLESEAIAGLTAPEAADFADLLADDLQLSFELHDESQQDLREALRRDGDPGLTERTAADLVAGMGMPDHSDHVRHLHDALESDVPEVLLDAVVETNGLRAGIGKHTGRMVKYLLAHPLSASDRARLWQAFANRVWTPNEWESRYVPSDRAAQHCFVGKAGELIVFTPGARPGDPDAEIAPRAGRILRMRVDPTAIQGPRDIPDLHEMRVLELP